MVFWLCQPCYAIVAGVLAGAAAAGVNTAINGGNFGQAIGMGAVLGGILGHFGGDLFKAFGGVPKPGMAGINWGNFVAAVKLGTVAGAAIGGLSTAINGGNFFQNVAFGALGGAMGAAAGYGMAYGVARTAQAWNTVGGTGGPSGDCPRCMGPGIAPPGKNPTYNISDLFEGNEEVTSKYGAPRGKLGMHRGLDVWPETDAYGTEMFAPGKVRILPGGYHHEWGDYIRYSPVGRPDLVILHGHTQLMTGLEPGMVIDKGTAIGTLTETGRLYGPNTHIEIHQGGRIYDPGTVFRR